MDTNPLMNVLNTVAPIIMVALELVGIAIILFGSLAALYNLIKSRFDLRENRTKVILGEALSLALEFKLGAEIIKTVVVQTIDELIVLGIIVVLRVLLTFVIHWEIKQADLADEFIAASDNQTNLFGDVKKEFRDGHDSVEITRKDDSKELRELLDKDKD